MGKVTVLLLGVLTLLAFGWIVVYPTAAQIETSLQREADEALARAGADWAVVEVDGQRAVLEGFAPSPEARQRAVDAVLGADGGGGLLLGGIVAVNDRASVGEVPRPYVWRAEAASGRVILSGLAPSVAARDALIDEARSLFVEGVDNRIQLAGGAPPGGWLDAARLGLRQLARLGAGEAALTDRVLRVSGQTADLGVVSEIASALTATPTGYRAEPDVVTTDVVLRRRAQAAAGAQAGAQGGPGVGPDGGTGPGRGAEGTGGSAGTASASAAGPSAPSPAEACQRRIDQALASGSEAMFAPGSVTIADGSEGALRRIAEALQGCEGVRLQIGGHTDSQGRESYNRQLSLQRASNVRDFLVAAGVDAARLEPVGFGSGQPVASNDTAEGRARNRRITFEVLP
jgi:outer membrane protein OmpA-like peptidoglycan-associated protein